MLPPRMRPAASAVRHRKALENGLQGTGDGRGIHLPIPGESIPQIEEASKCYLYFESFF